MESLKEIVSLFEDRRAFFRDNEAQTRISLINPLLQLLGWDITDPRVVRVEPPVQTLSGKKKADYILYDDRGLPVVVIEAKAPKVNIAKDTDAIFQLLRYGRNLDTVPVGILTDFEEWEVYNTSMDPTKDTQRVRIPDLCLRYTDYATEWDKLETHFSRTSVLEGKLRAFVTTTKTTLPLDYKFLKDLERYRKLIAQALVKGNCFAHDWDLNEATQRVLDRLLLLRILEDRGYGDRGGWLHRIAEADDPGRHLSDLVSRLQTTYNSRFFERHPVDDLRLEPGKLRKVLKELADPDSPYDFSAMPVEIIGKAYEQFLGSVIRTTPKQVRIEPKPEVRKAGGVYYTPRYIVDYIVENTLTPLFENKSLSQAAKIKILDPACGSGSFLIGAARWLGRWYSEKYGRPTTYEERQTIVLRHLHGVDIDSNAVEVTQLSLCLWLLEEAPLQLKMLHQALLPDLSGNIKCGNSLIGLDFYTSAGQQDLFDDALVRHRVNAFDWDGPRGWPEIMKKTTRRLWFVTFVTHNSRVSERMVELGVEAANPLVFNEDDQLLIAEKITNACRKYKIPVVTWNILPDHVHMLLAARDQKELSEHVHNIKGSSSRAYRKARGQNEGGHVWAQKFNRKPVKGEDALNSIFAYIRDNHLKHASQDKGIHPLDPSTGPQDKGIHPLDPSHKGLKPLVSDDLLAFRRKLEPILYSITVSVEEASQTTGGFDAVIGNPPWVDIKGMEPALVDYYFQRYSTTENRLNIYAIFIEKSLEILSTSGVFGFITPSSYLTQSSYTKLRKLILGNARIQMLVRLPDNVFTNVTAESAIVILNKKGVGQTAIFLYNREDRISEISEQTCAKIRWFSQEKWSKPPGFVFNIFITEEIELLLRNIEGKGLPFQRFCDFTLGLTPYDKYKGHTQQQIKSCVFHSDNKKDKTFKRLLTGADVNRYRITWKGGKWISYGKWLGAPREQRFFTQPRIIVRQIISGDPPRIYAGYTEEELYNTQIAFNLLLKPEVDISLIYLLALMNSKLMTFYHRNRFLDQSKSIFQKILIQDAKILPIRTIDFDNPEDVARHDRMVALVERMLDLHKRLPGAVGSDKAQIEQLIERTDREIDRLVYELYELTDDEIAIVEDAVK